MQRRRHRDIGTEQIQRMAVGRRTGGHFRGNHTTTARPVINNHLLAEGFAEFVTNHAGGGIVAAARGERNNQTYGFGRVILRRRARCRQ